MPLLDSFWEGDPWDLPNKVQPEPPPAIEFDTDFQYQPGTRVTVAPMTRRDNEYRHRGYQWERSLSRGDGRYKDRGYEVVAVTHTPRPVNATVLAVCKNYGQVIVSNDEGTAGWASQGYAQWVKDVCVAAGIDPEQSIRLADRYDLYPEGVDGLISEFLRKLRTTSNAYKFDVTDG